MLGGVGGAGASGWVPNWVGMSKGGGVHWWPGCCKGPVNTPPPHACTLCPLSPFNSEMRTARLFMGLIAPGTVTADLAQIFQPFGQVIDVDLNRDSGFVKFEYLTLIPWSIVYGLKKTQSRGCMLLVLTQYLPVPMPFLKDAERSLNTLNGVSFMEHK